MTAETKTRTKTPTKVLADVFLSVYLGENDVFIKVTSPDEIEEEHRERQKNIRRFYRWANATLGLTPKEVWDGQMRWARIPKETYLNGKRINTLKLLGQDFSLHSVTRKECLRSEL